LADIADFLDKYEVPYAVIGGIAVAVRGESRFTIDWGYLLHVGEALSEAIDQDIASAIGRLRKK